MQKRRQRGHQCLTFSGIHLCDMAIIQRKRSYQLLVIMTHTQPPTRNFPANRQTIRQQLGEKTVLEARIAKDRAELQEILDTLPLRSRMEKVLILLRKEREVAELNAADARESEDFAAQRDAQVVRFVKNER